MIWNERWGHLILLELLLEGKISMNNFAEISIINNEAGERRGESGSGDFDCLGLLSVLPVGAGVPFPFPLERLASSSGRFLCLLSYAQNSFSRLKC